MLDDAAIAAEISRLLERYDTETARRRYALVLAGDPQEAREVTQWREDQRAVLVERLRKEMTDGEHHAGIAAADAR